ncbi:LNS2-domain-containing protein [Sistotremastrum niveocremeum HHB9708]|uniref:phosphatidate phosphatase n=1 Tax=Sistotremastrum niveocremeum HHB9708 TaxID=1314777 RepID=A0A164ZM03_9AGAM|nr:LNS2-domain-containing protein [Sistotremastrum niveocremeum HHB9708]
MSTDPLTNFTLPTPPDPTSKNSQKKKAKLERAAAAKAERKAREKERKAQKRKARDEENPESSVKPAEQDASAQPKQKKRKLDTREKFKANVVVDLGFDNLMFEREMTSLCSQLSYCYSSNRRSRQPFSRLIFTSLGGKTKERLEATNQNDAHLRWQDVTWLEKGYESLWDTELQQENEDNEAPNPTDLEPTVLKQDVVYLTADSTETLEELSEGKTYVIGGIVDHNRYKNLCQGKAESQGLKTARLPIGEYMAQLSTRKVLTVNQVLDIMLHWVQERDWEKAFNTIIPKRKLKGTTDEPDDDEEETGDGNESSTRCDSKRAIDFCPNPPARSRSYRGTGQLSGGPSTLLSSYMYYLRGALNAASQYYKDLPPINPATLTGAIDVIVVRKTQPDGTQELACSPFHVSVLVNGNPIPFGMKVGDAGEAFFVFETEEDVPDDLMTSPLLTPADSEQSVETPKTTSQNLLPDAKETTPQTNTEHQLIPEPDFFDLDAQPESAESVETHGEGGEQATVKHNSEAQQQPIGPSAILDRATNLGKAVMTVVREERDEKLDRLKDATRLLPSSFSTAQPDPDKIVSPNKAADLLQDDENQPSTAQAPDVKYGKEVVVDTAGYHSGVQSTQPKRLSGDTSDHGVETSSSSHSHRSSMASIDIGDANQRPTTPETSLPDSPISYAEDSLKVPKLPVMRATSEPPEESRASSPPPEYSWEWGSFPRKSTQKQKFAAEEPLFHRSSSLPQRSETIVEAQSSDGVFGAGGRLNADEQDPYRCLLEIEGHILPFELSLCGQLSGDDEVEDSNKFQRSRITYKNFMKRPSIVMHDDLVINWENKYITREDASPLFGALVHWRETALATHGFTSEEEPLSSGDEGSGTEDHDTPVRKVSSTSTPKTNESSRWSRWWNRSRNDTTPVKEPQPSERPNLPEARSEPSLDNELASPSMGTSSSAGTVQPAVEAKKFAKTLRLTSGQLEDLKLQPGANTITFSLSSSGVVTCAARIFLWDTTDKIVVSDIDGTITKSDALGHVLTMIGRDWTHIGVAKLYTDICRNGYKIMYLTSRAIGQADSTRVYLKGINQNNYQLPEGPVIMSPDRLMASLHREVIMRKPEVFKMACLRDIRRLFGSYSENPFYAGFGNRITDALSYRSVDIPSTRIFTIDSSGEVKTELLEKAGYKSSYTHMSDLVDQQFPPIHRNWVPEFTDFSFWKQPIQEFELPDLGPPSPALSARSDTSAFTRLRNFGIGRQTSRTPVLEEPRPRKDTPSSSPMKRSTTSNDLKGSSSTRPIDIPRGDSESADERALRRLSTGSIPGSLPDTGFAITWSHSDYGSTRDYRNDNDVWLDDEEDGDDDEEDGDEDLSGPEEEDDEIDESLLAEMKNVPF